MATNPIYIVQLKRWVNRLRDDKHPLTEQEWKNLNEMLNMDEQIEADRRAADELSMRQLQVLPLDHPVHQQPEVWRISNHLLRDDLVFALRYRPVYERLVEKRQTLVDKLEAQNALSPANLKELAVQRDWLENAKGLLDGLLNRVFDRFDELNELEKRVWKHRGERTWDNLPHVGESSEDYYFPEQPTSKRVGYIEVIQAKLTRLEI